MMTRDDLDFDLKEALKAVLYFWGPGGAQKVTAHILEARQKRDEKN